MWGWATSYCIHDNCRQWQSFVYTFILCLLYHFHWITGSALLNWNVCVCTIERCTTKFSSQAHHSCQCRIVTKINHKSKSKLSQTLSQTARTIINYCDAQSRKKQEWCLLTTTKIPPHVWVWIWKVMWIHWDMSRGCNETCGTPSGRGRGVRSTLLYLDIMKNLKIVKFSNFP